MHMKAIVTGVVSALVLLAVAAVFAHMASPEIFGSIAHSDSPISFSNPEKMPIPGSRKAKLCALTSVGVSPGHICAVYRDEQTGDWIAEASGPEPNGAVCKAACLY
jgi:hypothetical protein